MDRPAGSGTDEGGGGGAGGDQAQQQGGGSGRRKRKGFSIPSFEEMLGQGSAAAAPQPTIDLFASSRGGGTSSSSSSTTTASAAPVVRSSHFTTSLVLAAPSPTSPTSTSTSTSTSASTSTHVVASATTTAAATATAASSTSTASRSASSAYSASALMTRDPYALSSPTMLNALLAAHPSPTAASTSSTSSSSTSYASPRGAGMPSATTGGASSASSSSSSPSLFHNQGPSAGRRGPARPLLVNTRQRGNRLIKYLHNVRWEYSESVLADYVMGGQACALYLSIKYHLLHPEYIITRMRQLGSRFNLSIVLCLVDVEGNTQPLEELMMLCTNMGFTLICAWSLAEAARYLETYKAYEYKGAKIIKERVESSDPYAVLSDCLTAVRGVNKTDVLTLSSTFGSLKNIIDCSMEELSLCPGLGARKVKNLYETFHAPLDPTKKKRQKTESQIESFLNRKVRRGGSEPTTAAVPASSAKGKEKANDDDEEEASQ